VNVSVNVGVNVGVTVRQLQRAAGVSRSATGKWRNVLRTEQEGQAQGTPARDFSSALALEGEADSEQGCHAPQRSLHLRRVAP
jgi:hypothetical protein